MMIFITFLCPAFYLCLIKCALNINRMIKANCHIVLSKVANQFIYLFIYLCLVNLFYRFMLTLNTFEDVILTSSSKCTLSHVCFMHSMLFSRTNYDTHAKTGQNQLKLIWKSVISGFRAQYQLFEHNIIQLLTSMR